MHESPFGRFLVPILLAAPLCVAVVSPISLLAEEEPADAPDLSQYYGFEELEIFKLEPRSQSMQPADLNDDGLTDLVLIDNSHSRLDLLQQRNEKPDQRELLAADSDVNALGNGWRFEHRKIPVDKKIGALAVGDLNGNGRTDLAYLGEPEHLVIRYQPEEDEWTERRRFRLPDIPATQGTLAAGDLNGDGRDDIAVLGKFETYLLYQEDEGTFDRPERLMNTSQNLKRVQIADLDGDGRNDLGYTTEDDPQRSFCARLQQADGDLSPEMRFEIDKPRGLSLFNLDGRPGEEVLTIDSRTERVHVQRLERPESQPGELAGRLTQYGFGRRGSSRNRSLAVGDLDGDGLADVVVTEPETAQMIVFRQRKEQGLDLGRRFPSFVGGEQIRVGRFDGSRRAEVVVLSKEEKTIGLSRMTDGRLTFPQALPVDGEPMALELADLDDDGRSELVYIAKSGDGGSEYRLRGLQKSEDGWQPFSFGDRDHIALELSGEPQRMLRLDANHDDRPDFLIFPGLGRPPELAVLDEKGVPEQVTTQGGVALGALAPGAVAVGELDEPVVLVAQRNFARNIRLDEKLRWQVVDQYNAVESDAKIVGVATLDLDGEPGNEIVLVDEGIGKLRVLRREESLYEPWREVDIGNFPYKSTRVADLNGDDREDLLLFGRGKSAVLYAGRTDPSLEELASYETDLEDAYPADVVSGDLNGDGRPELAVIDTRSHRVEIVAYDPERGLRRALHFKVFEEKSFRRRGGSGSEPREAVIADVTGDGRADLILLAHDRVLLYPQDAGDVDPQRQARNAAAAVENKP